jgi:hypothetical protein
VRSMAPELNDSEGATPSGWGAALGSGKALGPAQGERGGVRWLSTDSVAGTEARRGGGSLPEADKRPSARTTSNGVASSYRHAHGVRGGMAQAWHVVHNSARIVRACTCGHRAQRGSNRQELAWR